MSDIETFMSRVVPWPADGAPGWINLHWRIPNPHDPKKPDMWVGKPTRTLSEFMKLLTWVKARSNTKDIYFCLSLQGKTGTNTKGNKVAARLAEDALLLKSLWLDLDVKSSEDKPTKKGYPSVGAALEALSKFCEQQTIAKPDALVGSGGGVHCYWISPTPFTRTEWQPYADGLKTAAINFGLQCDIGCTVDSARVLRVPGTFNYKTLPLRPVKILGMR